MLYKDFHRRSRNNRPKIPDDKAAWPAAWTTVQDRPYARFMATPLPDPLPLSTSLTTALKSRASDNTYAFDSSRSVDQETFSTLLFYSASSPAEPRTLTSHRFHPSGGARYPLELYLLVQRVAELPPAMYHYHPINHVVTQLPFITNPHDLLPAAASYLGKPLTTIPAFILILTADLSRGYSKYHDLAYQAALMEAGHLMQNIQLLSAALGLNNCPHLGFKHDELHQSLELESEDLILYTNPIGHQKE